MSKYRYEGDKQFKPVSAWGYVGYSILFAIPLIGFILLIVFSCSTKNINRRNYARSFFCWLLIAIIIGILTFAGIFSAFKSDSFPSWLSTAQNTVQMYTGKILNRTSKVTDAPKTVESEVSPQQNSAERSNSTHEYTLKEGKYIIGKDIVPGNYIINCTETAGESVGKSYGSIGNMMDALDDNSNGDWSELYGSLGNLMGEYINMTVDIIGDYGDILRTYEMKKGESISIQLEEGTAIQITDGSCEITSK